MTHNNQVNDTRFADLEKQVRAYGREAALGADALPKLALAVVKAAADGVIDIEPKHVDPGDKSNKIADVDFLYRKYTEEEGKKAAHEMPKNSLKAQISKLNQFRELGISTVCDPMKVMDDAHKLRKTLAANGEKVKGAYAAYLDVARVQKGLDREITRDEMVAAIRKPEPKDKDVIKELEAIRKRIERLIEGKDGVQDNSTLVEDAYHALNDRIKVLQAPAQAEKLTEQTAELVSLMTNDQKNAMLKALGIEL